MTTPGAQATTRVPVVLPFVRVELSGDGPASITVDGEPYGVAPARARLGRDTVPHILDEIATRYSQPVRVEVIDAGASFTDIVIPRHPSVAAAPLPGTRADALGEVAGHGFTPGESVAIAVVVADQSADDQGVARLRVPSALLENHAVVLLGKTSGTVAFSSRYMT